MSCRTRLAEKEKFAKVRRIIIFLARERLPKAIAYEPEAKRFCLSQIKSISKQEIKEKEGKRKVEAFDRPSKSPVLSQLLCTQEYKTLGRRLTLKTGVLRLLGIQWCASRRTTTVEIVDVHSFASRSRV